MTQITIDRAVLEQALDALGHVLGPRDDEKIGWRRYTGHATELTCEFCGKTNEDTNLLDHLDDCPVIVARAALTAGRAALAQPASAPAAVSGWKPIESAPKDGTPIIISRIENGTVFDVCNGNIEVVKEDEDDGPWDIRDGEPWCSYKGREAGTYFCSWLPGMELEDRWLMMDSFEYTHWMPLPAAPQQEQKGGEL